MPKNFQQVSYSKFRTAISKAAGQKVKNRGATTYLYDQKNNALAVLQAASIDAFGRTKPAQYYVRTLAA